MSQRTRLNVVSGHRLDAEEPSEGGWPLDRDAGKQGRDNDVGQEHLRAGARSHG